MRYQHAPACSPIGVRIDLLLEPLQEYRKVVIHLQPARHCMVDRVVSSMQSSLSFSLRFQHSQLSQATCAESDIMKSNDQGEGSALYRLSYEIALRSCAVA